MDSIRFTATNQTPFRPEVLNHRTASPFQQNQIQFHIGSDYLQDFTDQGIEKFVKRHQSGAKDLSVAEVKTFIQRVAANAESAKNMTFDLADAELGLYTDDKIENRHLQGAFTLNVSDKAYLPAGQARNVRFVDVTSASFDLKEKETEISAHQKTIRETQTKLKELRETHADTKDDRDTARRILGPDAQQRLDRALERKGQIAQELEQLGKDESAYKEELKKPDLAAGRKQELERMLRALPEERRALTEERKQIDEDLEDNTGPLLQRTNLNDLKGLNERFTREEAEIKRLEAKIQEELGAIREVVDRPSADAPKPGSPAADSSTGSLTGSEDVTVGPGLDIETFRQLPPGQQAQRVAQLPGEKQQALIAQMTPEERTKLATDTDKAIEGLASAQSTTEKRNLANYQTLKQNLQTATQTSTTTSSETSQSTSSSSTASQTASTTGSQTASTTSSATSQTATSTSSSSQTTTTTTTTTSNSVSVGPAQQNLPAGALTNKDGQPLMVSGQIATLESFKSASMEVKFSLLMKANPNQLLDLLKSMTKEERAQIKTMAQQVVDNYVAKYGPPVAGVNTTAGVVTNTTVTSTASVSGSGRATASAEETAQYEQAQLIIRLINQLDGPGSTSSTASSTQTAQTTQTQTIRGHQLAAHEYVYQVKPGDTATSIAQSELKNPLYNYDIFQRNQGLEQAMINRNQGRTFDRYKEDLSQYQEYRELILSRNPGQNPVQTAQTKPSTVTTASSTSSTATLTEETVTTPSAPAATPGQPSTTPSVTQSSTQPSVPTATLTEEDVPATTPSVTTQPSTTPSTPTQSATTPSVTTPSQPEPKKRTS